MTFTEWVARNILGMPELASSTGQPVDDLIVYVHYLMLVLFIGWITYFGYVLYRFNAKRNPKADYEGSKSHIPHHVEWAVIGIEAFLLLVLAVPLWAKSVEQFPALADSTVIQVVAQQYAWNIRYAGPDGIFGRQDMKFVAIDNVFGVDPTDAHGKDDVQVLNEMHVVVNKPVIIYLSSKDVIHSFKVLAMRVTQDAIPGLRIPLTFTPNKVGRYQINCAQLCGSGHASMSGGFMIVESQADFDKWLASKSGAATSFE
jgi:cytochrome c oxidase subunit 2